MSKDSIVETHNEEGHTFVLTHYFDTRLCFDLVKEAAESYWATKGKTDAIQNYKFDDETPWSLGQMLLNQNFELGFSVVTMDGKFLAASGVRKHGSNEAIILSRFFGINSLHPYGNAFMLPLHQRLCREAGLESCIITFNSYNEHLLNYYTRILPRKKDKFSQMVYQEIKEFKSLGKKQINNVEQFVLSRSF